MSKTRLAGFICVFAALVLVVLAFALPIYKTPSKAENYTGKDAVIAGSDGFLFRVSSEKRDVLLDFSGDRLLSDAELDGYVSALNGISKQLSEKGCRCVFVFVPSKLAVYRDKLPSDISGIYSETRRFTQICTAMKGSGSAVVDLYTYFDGIKDEDQLYHTASDTLNDMGGYRLFEKTAERINLQYDTNIMIPQVLAYDVEVTEDTAYPLTREYRNITGKTVPNRTVTLKEKEISYKDANYAYDLTKATEMPVENRADGFDYPRLMILDTGASSSCFKFFSASSALCVYRGTLTPDDAVTDRAKPEFAVIIINEDETDSVPYEHGAVEINDLISAAPVIKETVYSDAEHFVIFGTVEKESTVSVTGGAENVSVYTKDGEFVIEVPILTDPEESYLTVQCKTGDKKESAPVQLSARYTKLHKDTNVVVGKEGHLHYRETIPDFTGESAFPDETVAQCVGYLSAKADAIHEVSPDTKLIYVVPPDHITVYPETAPDSLAGLHSDVSRLTQFIEALKGSEKLTFIDLRTPLLEAKKTAPYRLYNKTDTHWNELGAYYAYREIMNVISADFPAAAPDPLDDFDVFTKEVSGGDMANFLNADLNTVTEEGVYVRAKNGLQSGISKDYSMNFANTWFSDYHEFNTDNKELPTMIMFRDSFSTNLMSFLAEKFSYSVFYNMWEYPDDYDLIKELQPDYLIIEHVERSFGGY